MALVVGALVIACGVFVGAHLALAHPRLTVYIGPVEGTSVLSERLVRARAESVLYDGSYRYVPRTSILTYPRSEIERSLLSTFERLKQVEVTRASFFATELVVRVEERSAKARWCVDPGTPERCYLVDDAGFIFASATQTDSVATRYVLSGGVEAREPVGAIFAKGSGVQVLSTLDALASAGFVPLGATMSVESDISIPLERGYFLMTKLEVDAERLVRDLKLILGSEALFGKEGELEYVDLRFGNRVYYRLKGGQEKSGMP